MNEITDDTNRLRDIQCSWIGRLNIMKMTILSNVIYRFSAIPNKLPVAFFQRMWTRNFAMCVETKKDQWHFSEKNKKNLKIVWRHKRPRIYKTILMGKKKKWSWRNQAPWIQTILQSYSHQNCMVLALKTGL